MSRLKVDAAALRNEASRMRTVSYRIDDMANRAAKVARDSKGHSIHYEYGGNVKALTGELRQEARKLRTLATALEKTARTYENAENRVVSNLNWIRFADSVSSVCDKVDLVNGILDGAGITELPRMPETVPKIMKKVNAALIIEDFGEDWKEQMDSGEAGYSAGAKAAEHAALGIIVSEGTSTVCGVAGNVVGKITGGTVGAAIGGPAGAAVGSVAGAVVGAHVGKIVGTVIAPKVTEVTTKVIDEGYDCYEQNYIDMKGNVPCKM